MFGQLAKSFQNLFRSNPTPQADEEPTEEVTRLDPDAFEGTVWQGKHGGTRRVIGYAYRGNVKVVEYRGGDSDRVRYTPADKWDTWTQNATRIS